MKKILLAILMSLTLAACSTAAPETTPEAEETSTPEPTTEVAVMSFGSGSVTGISIKSDADAENDGESRISTTICVVALEGDVIKDVIFDTIQVSAKVDAMGVNVTDTNVLSKKEKGDDYGMVAYGGSISEWYQEVADLEDYLTGKTVSEALGIEADETMMTELSTTTTIGITDFIMALDKAVMAAEETEFDSISLGHVTTFNPYHNSDATEEAEGMIEASVTYAAVAYDADGKIASVKFDVAQNSTTFDTTGVFTTDTAAATPTKGEKGDDYGMVAYGGAIAEWYEQAAGLEANLIGLTVSEALALPDNADSLAEIQTTTTISIDDFMAALAKAE